MTFTVNNMMQGRELTKFLNSDTLFAVNTLQLSKRETSAMFDFCDADLVLCRLSKPNNRTERD